MEFLPFYLSGAAALILAIVLRAPWFKGMSGERFVKARLARALDPDDYRQLHDLTLPSGSGTTQIDHVVLSRFGVFVIETKNMTGWIFGDERQARWTQVLHRKKYPFQNPLRQNYKHVKTVQELLDLAICRGTVQPT